MLNLKVQILGESLNSKMVGLRHLHFNSRLVKLSTSTSYIFLYFKTERKVLGNETEMRLGVEQNLEIQNH